MTKFIKEVGEENGVQVIINNAPMCKSVGMIIEVSFPKVFWTPCVAHTLNLALKNICATKNTEGNDVYMVNVIGLQKLLMMFLLLGTLS